MFIEFFKGTRQEQALLRSRDQLRSRANLSNTGKERLASLELEAKSISRKLLLRKMGAAGVTLAFVAMGMVVWPSLNPSQGSENQKSAMTTTVSSYPLRDKLMDWDNKITAGSIDLLTIAPEIANLATQTLCGEIECDPSYKEQLPLNFLSNRDLKRSVYEDDPCDTSVNLNDDTQILGYAYTRPLTGDMIFNADYLQYTDIQRKVKRSNIASLFFQIYMHESLHNRAKTIQAQPGETVFVLEENESYPLIIKKGFRSFYRSYKYYSRSENGCVLGMVHERLIEEAVVDYATQQILRKVGLNLPTTYQNLIQLYRARVLDPFFGGDYKVPLKFQQSTDQDGFYSALGQAIAKGRGVSLSPKQQISEARSYIAGALNLGLQ